MFKTRFLECIRKAREAANAKFDHYREVMNGKTD
jgi:hypothetical protein